MSVGKIKYKITSSNTFPEDSSLLLGLNALSTPYVSKSCDFGPLKKNGYFDPLTFGPLLIS